METQAIKTDLFRFVTLRSPQAISQGKRDIGFIEHPNPEASHFIGKLADESDRQQALRKLHTLKQSYSAWMSKQTARQLSPELYDFGAWVLENRTRLDVESLLSRVASVSELSKADRIHVWDQLFYQVLKRDQPTVRQACILLIKADHLVRRLAQGKAVLQSHADDILRSARSADPEQQAARLVRMIKRFCAAKVVIPKAFVMRGVEKVSSDSHPQSDPPKQVVPQRVSKDFTQVNVAHTNGVSRARGGRLRQIKKELEAGKRRSMRRRDDMSVGTLLANDGDALSVETREFIAKSVADHNDIPSAIRKVGDSLRRESKRILGPRQAGRRDLMSRGHLVRDKADDLYCFGLSFMDDELNAKSETSAEQVAYMTINVGYSEAYIEKTNWRLRFDDDSGVFETAKVSVLKNETSYLQLRLFPEQSFAAPRDSMFEIQGSLTLDDGITVVIQAKGRTFNERTNGCASVRDGRDDSELDSESDAKESATPKVRVYGVNKVGVAVFRKVEQEVCCYVAGEVSRIENILAREYKERATRSLTRSEISTETSSELEVENVSDTATSERNEMQSEVANVLEKDKSTAFGASLGVSGKYPGGEVTANTYADFTSSNSSSVSDSAAKTWAQEITEKTLERVVQKTSEKRTSKIVKEFEETNKHGFDNRAGDQHVTGVYRWVDIIYDNRLINYGKRLTYEFMIPEPAAGYKHMLRLLEKRAEKEHQAGLPKLVQPVAPELSDLKIAGPSDLNQDNYLEAGRLYGVTLPEPMPETETTSKSFSPANDPNMKDTAYQFEVMVPPEYEAVSGTLDASFEYKYSTAEHNTQFTVFIGDYRVIRFGDLGIGKKDGFRDKDLDRDFTFANPWSGQVGCSVDVWNINSFSVGVILDLKWKPALKNQWRQEAYDLIMRAYNDLVDEYQAALAARELDLQGSDDNGDNPNLRFNRSLEQRELQRICIEMITEPFNVPQGMDFYTRNRCNAKLTNKEHLDRYASHVKFFEQAFEWEIMSYLYYPYYWADDCSWADLLQTEYAPDPIFQAFLQSGMARVTVPVRPGFEEAVTYYMETGDIWNGGDLVLDTDDELYLSVAEELQEIEGFVEEKWQTRVPTALTVVQADSVALNESGLPCCDSESENNTLIPDSGKLEIAKPSSD